MTRLNTAMELWWSRHLLRIVDFAPEQMDTLTDKGLNSVTEALRILLDAAETEQGQRT